MFTAVNNNKQFFAGKNLWFYSKGKRWNKSSNIIKGKIQHDKAFAAAAATATAINFKKNNLNLIRATLPN